MARAWLFFRLITPGKLEYISSVYLIPSFRYHLSIFEIYPQSEKPLLTEIARLDWGFSTDHPPHLLPDTLICRAFYGDRIIFRVVDYRTNYSTCFTADVQRYYSDDVEVLFCSSQDVEVSF